MRSQPVDFAWALDVFVSYHAQDIAVRQGTDERLEHCRQTLLQCNQSPLKDADVVKAVCHFRLMFLTFLVNPADYNVMCPLSWIFCVLLGYKKAIKKNDVDSLGSLFNQLFSQREFDSHPLLNPQYKNRMLNDFLGLLEAEVKRLTQSS